MRANRGIILVTTWAAQPKAMISTLSHNFISINPVTTDAPTPEIFVLLADRDAHAGSFAQRLPPRPLYSALAAGCMGVDADVWLSPDKTNLLVGHQASHLSVKRTLQSLYLDPIKQILGKLNLTPPFSPARLPLHVEYNITASSTASESRPVFKRGPITVVGTGNLGMSNVTGTGCNALSRYSDSFLDAPLDSLINASNFGSLPSCGAESLQGSLSPNIIPHPPHFCTTSDPSSPSSTTATPKWPISRRDHVWQVLAEEDAGLLNADDIQTRVKWTRAYAAELVWIGVSSAYISVASLLMAYLYQRSGNNSIRSGIIIIILK
ncbi:hypothetical protein E4U55_005789 [Claviceps digitariae]|nr:hypothetical protein E4U55_005789 [Claviceps digitariae]